MIATLDRRARPLRDLRISVTDRCNFRCSYCMPKELFGGDFAFLPRSELLSFEEIVRLARLFVDQGVTKIRLTGGEPLMRRDLERLVEMLAGVAGVQDLALTTNAALLVKKARSLADAGLNRITVSLDALDDQVFQTMNDVSFPVQRVLDGIDAAVDAGLTPLKVNMVVRRDVNDHCVIAMAEHFRHSGQILRFIEYMDVGTANGWTADDVVGAEEILGSIGAVWPIEPLDPDYPGQVATRYRYSDGAGEIGVIASVTQPFCGSCTRARLSADGKLHTCLFAASGHDLRPLLRGGASDEEIARHLNGTWRARADRYSEARSPSTAGQPKVEMSYIGG